MKIHAEIKTQDATFAVSESGGRGWEWGQRVKLRLVRIPKGVEYRCVRSPGVKAIETCDADARNQGPRSAYGIALARLMKRLPAVAAAG